MRIKAVFTVSVLLFTLFSSLSGQTGTIGVYTGPVLVLPTDAENRPINSMNHGLVYNHPIFFDLSVEAIAGISRTTFIDDDPLSPGNTVNPWFETGLYLAYWPLNDILGLASKRRDNCRIQTEIVSNPYNFYLFGGADYHRIMNKTDRNLSDQVINATAGIGVHYFFQFQRDLRGFNAFAEAMYSRNLTPYFTLNGEEFTYAFVNVRIGIRYSFMSKWRNAACK